MKNQRLTETKRQTGMERNTILREKERALKHGIRRLTSELRYGTVTAVKTNPAMI
jgi:hypothetical protein